jgi:GT2 family glycosyltransferase
MVSIVVITMNTRDLLEGLLLSIEADTGFRPLIAETIVVDNGSDDGTVVMIRDRFPWVTHVRNLENRGFAASVNIGFGRSSEDVVFLLNSDTRLIPGESEKMVAFLNENPTVGVVGPQLVYENMRLQRSYAHMPSLASELIPRALAATIWPQKYHTKGEGIVGPVEVETIIGAGLMVRRAAFLSVGGFDERFFFFLEETDFCLQLGRLSWTVVFLPTCRLVHLQGKTVGRRWVAGRIEYSISLYKFMGKYHGTLYVAAFAGVRVLKALCFLLPVSVIPLLWIDPSIRRKYKYYGTLLVWHLRGCPDGAGLRPIPQGRKELRE